MTCSPNRIDERLPLYLAFFPGLETYRSKENMSEETSGQRHNQTYSGRILHFCSGHAKNLVLVDRTNMVDGLMTSIDHDHVQSLIVIYSLP